MTQNQITTHSLSSISIEGRKDDQETAQVENLKDQITHATIVQSISNAAESFEGRKNGKENAHVESLNEHKSLATIDQSTDSQGATQEEAETCVISISKEGNHNDKAIKETTPQTLEDVATKSKSNPSQKRRRR